MSARRQANLPRLFPVGWTDRFQLRLRGHRRAANHSLEFTLKFFPPEAFYALTAMSDRALAYSNEPLSTAIS